MIADSLVEDRDLLAEMLRSSDSSAWEPAMEAITTSRSRYGYECLIEIAEDQHGRERWSEKRYMAIFALSAFNDRASDVVPLMLRIAEERSTSDERSDPEGSGLLGLSNHDTPFL